jgi:FMN phosphatase YigB (HAD superfamily)
MKLLVTDLDNTLYDWVTFFSTSFAALVSALEVRFDIPRNVLLREFKQVHQYHHNSEHPFAACELPSVLSRFPGMSRAQVANELSPDVFQAFNSARKQILSLYPGVKETLTALREQGVRIVGHTEAIAPNAIYRLDMLGVLGLFDRLYAIESHLEPHPRGGSHVDPELPPGFLRSVAASDRKPNPKLLLDICDLEKVSLTETVYVGDSIARDIMMAKQAGVTSVWAIYGTKYDPIAWNLLVQVTHWSDDDVAREAQLKAVAKNVHPDYVIESFSELLGICSTPSVRRIESLDVRVD